MFLPSFPANCCAKAEEPVMENGLLKGGHNVYGHRIGS